MLRLHALPSPTGSRIPVLVSGHFCPSALADRVWLIPGRLFHCVYRFYDYDFSQAFLFSSLFDLLILPFRRLKKKACPISIGNPAGRKINRMVYKWLLSFQSR